MAARFTKGDSMATTGTTRSQNRPTEPKTSSYGAKAGNTMSGMPGFINAGQTASKGGAKGGPSISPRKEGPIGQRGKSRAASMGKAAPGTTTKSYRAASTGSAGKVERLKAPTSFEGRGKRKSLMY